MYRYKITWLSDYTNSEATEYGYVAATSVSEAAALIEKMYTGADTHIYELQLYEVENVLPDSELRENFEEIPSY